MKGKIFLDANILVYLFSTTEIVKSEQINTIIQTYSDKNQLVWSTQVIQEFYAVMSRKYNVQSLQIKKIIDTFSHLECVVNDVAIIKNAIDIQVINQLSFWDSLIISSAKTSKCTYLLSEDLNAGQRIEGIQVVNPFLTK
jgi:predicted nucleic acid-binding protein